MADAEQYVGRWTGSNKKADCQRPISPAAEDIEDLERKSMKLEVVGRALFETEAKDIVPPSDDWGAGKL